MNASVLQTAQELKRTTYQHAPNDFTLKRSEQKEIELLALSEGFGSFFSGLLQREVRGAENNGFWEDIDDGVKLCEMLRLLGISVIPPNAKPRNEFEKKINRQNFRAACQKARFTSVPDMDRGPWGLIPTLLEMAKIALVQNERNPNRSATLVPDSLVKRVEDLSSPVVQAAEDGNVVAIVDQREAPSSVDAKMTSAAATTAQRRLSDTIRRASGHEAIAASSSSSSSSARRVSVNSDSSPNSSRRVSISSDSSSTRRVSISSDIPKPRRLSATDTSSRSTRARTASEIPPDEKDRLFYTFLGICVSIFLLLYLLLSNW